MTDFRALCAELVAIEDAISSGNVQLSSQGQVVDGYAALAAFRYVADKARITLAQPEAEGASLAHEAYVAFVQICKGNSDDAGTYESDEELVRRALKRLSDLEMGRPAIEPVPVSARLPGPEDCFPNNSGQRSRKCWAQRYCCDSNGEPVRAIAETWDLVDYQGLARCRRWYYAWLPAHALPVPQP
jgi:hypothetical protein